MSQPDLEDIKAALLSRATIRATSSAKLLDRVEPLFPGRGDDVRLAYWVLVGDGGLIRTAGGVRRGTVEPG